MLGSGKPYQLEPPVLEEESYASNDSFHGLKRERMIHFLYKWLLRKQRYIIEMNTVRNSFRKFCDLLSLPHAVSIFGFCCLRSHVELRSALNANANTECYCYSEWFTFMYNTLWCDVLKYQILKEEGANYFSISMQLCKKKTAHLWPFNHAHFARENLMALKFHVMP